MKIILQGITGSKLYGLDHADSDTDRQGIFVVPTHSVLGIRDYKESIVTNNPDVAMHEVKKFMRLALKCNPTVSELLWLPEYEVLTFEGRVLVENRKLFLSDRAVRGAYMGYATAQAGKLQKRESEGLEGFGPKVKKRSPKHARHLRRLTEQCEGLLRTGELTLRVKDREALFEFGEWPSADIISWFEAKQQEIDSIESVLPNTPNVDVINDILVSIRERN